MMTLNHGLSGYVCGQVAMPLLRRRSPLPERALGWAFFLGAMLPDMDILTRALLGRAAYFSQAWYGHRALSHSLLGTLLLALLAAGLLYWPLAHRAVNTGAGAGASPLRAYGWLAGCAWAGGVLHLFGDLFTPGWQLPLFWPLEPRYGALRHIGWFSPYLLWLFVTAMALAALAVHGGSRLRRLRPWASVLAWGVYALAAVRWVSFLLTSRYGSNDQWMAYQQELLPDALILPLTRGVHALWYWFTG